MRTDYLRKSTELLYAFNSFCEDYNYLEAQITIEKTKDFRLAVYWLEEREEICEVRKDSIEKCYEGLYCRFLAFLLEDEEFVAWAKENEIYL